MEGNAMKVTHIVVAIIISWLVVLSPYIIPALNVTTRIFGIPLTIWISIIVFAICLVVNEIAFHKTWVIFDQEESSCEKEGE